MLSLYANGNTEQTSIYLAKGAISEVGTWEFNATDTLTVTLTGAADKTYDEPAVTVYAVDGEALSDGPFVPTMLPEVTPEEVDAMTVSAAATAAEEPAADASAVTAVAVDQSDVMPATDSPGRIITLTLSSNNTLVMATDFMNDKPLIVEIGTWEEGEDGQFTISITGTPEEEYAESDVITFAQQDDQIVAVEYDETMWGSAGLTLTEVQPE